MGTTTSSRATRIVPEQRQPTDCHRLHQNRPIRNAKVDYSSKSGLEIEIQWKNDENINRRVHFDPTMNWKLETRKAEQGHLRRLAETEFKSVEANKKGILKTEKIGRMDRLKETFLFISHCDVELLVDEYCKDMERPGTGLVAGMFDLLITNAGIKRPRENTQEQDCTGAKRDTTSVSVEERAMLSARFLALQLKLRNIFDTNSAIIWGLGYTNTVLWSRLSCRTKQALYFIHCLSPLFRVVEKDSKQRQVYNLLYGDVANFEEYLFQDIQNQTGDNAALKDLRDQVHAYFGSLLTTSKVPPWLHFGPLMMGTDLNNFFRALRRMDSEDDTSCDWQCCCDDDDNSYSSELPSMFVPYDSLPKHSKLCLFVIHSMPAFRAYLVARKDMTKQQQRIVLEEEVQDCFEGTQCAELLMQSSSFLGFSLAGNSEDSNASCESSAIELAPESNAAAAKIHSLQSIEPERF